MSKTSCRKTGGWLLAAVLLLGTGCRSNDVNPTTAKANTGYVDLYASTSDPLSWDVKEINPQTHETKTLISETKPKTEPVVRLGLPPGRYQLQITLLNRAMENPARVEVNVQAGVVTPVKIDLQDIGEVSVRHVETSIRPSIKQHRMGKDIDYPTSDLYHLVAAPQQPLAYQPKEKMPYYK